MKKIHGDIIFSKLCITNDDQLIYGYWDMENNRIFCNIGPIFALLPNIKLKNQNFEKMKNTLEISLFYTSAPEIMIICYTVSEIWRVADVICIFHFGLYFAILPPYQHKNQIEKKKKNCLEISSFYTCVPKIMITWCTIPETWCKTDRWMDGRTEEWADRQTGGQKKWHMEVAAQI